LSVLKSKAKSKNARPRAFLAAFRLTGSVTRAAEAAGIEKTAHYRWLKHEPYAKAFADACEQFGDTLEGEAIRRANEGVLEGVYYQGAPCGAIRVYSDGLMQFLLKGFKPEKYGNKLQAEVNVTGTLDLVDRLNAARKRAAKLNEPKGGKPEPEDPEGS
jgi:hypothetical protein